LSIILCASRIECFRNLARWVVRVGARLVLFIFGFFTISCRGKRDPRVSILVSNHVGFLEILWFIWRDSPAFVMKKDCLSTPFVSQVAMRVLNSISVEHGEKSGGGGGAAVLAYVRGNHPLPLLVFPEGTTSNGTAVLPFHKGAFLSLSPVQPVVVRFPFRRFSPCWESITVPVFLLRLCSQVYNTLEVTYLPAQRPTPSATIESFTESVRVLMAKVIRVPLSPSIYADKREYQQRLAAFYKAQPRWCPFLVANLVFPSPVLC